MRHARSSTNFLESDSVGKDRIREASLLLYLNRTCFNGLYRENSDGEFNVSFGRYTNPDWVQEQRIRKTSRTLQGTEVFNTDFTYVLEEATEGDPFILIRRTSRCRKQRTSIRTTLKALTDMISVVCETLLWNSPKRMSQYSFQIHRRSQSCMRSTMRFP